MTRNPGQKKSFADSNFAEEVRRLTSQKKKIIDVSRDFVQKEQSGSVNLAKSIYDLAIARDALTLDPVAPHDRLLREVFAFCALDATDPWHWRILLEATIETDFKRSGAHEKWDEGALFELQMDIRELQKKYPSAQKNNKIAQLLKKTKPFESKYGEKELAYLRKLVGKSRDPRFNPMIEYDERGDFLNFLAKRRAADAGVSVEMAQALIDKLVEEQIEQALEDYQHQVEASGNEWTDAIREDIRPEIAKVVRANFVGEPSE